MLFTLLMRGSYGLSESLGRCHNAILRAGERDPFSDRSVLENSGEIKRGHEIPVLIRVSF